VDDAMTRPSSVSAPEELFEAIAKLLEPGQREYFYQRMLYFRQLRPEDELLRLVEAIGLLALLIREAPLAIAREREQMAQLLETSLATIQVAGEAGQAYQRQLDSRLTRLPADLARGISPEAIARAITESLRQQFVHSGLPATADGLTAISQQVTHATGQLQRAAGLLSDCTDIADQAQAAIDRMSTSVAKATDTTQWAVGELTHRFSVECRRAVCLLCGAAWLLGILGGVAFERWRGGGIPVLPQAMEVPALVEEPSSPATSHSKKPTPAPARDRREPPHPKPHGEHAEPAGGSGVERSSNTHGSARGPDDAKPKA
jgi:hypothetical protein